MNTHVLAGVVAVLVLAGLAWVIYSTLNTTKEMQRDAELKLIPILAHMDGDDWTPSRDLLIKLIKEILPEEFRLLSGEREAALSWVTMSRDTSPDGQQLPPSYVHLRDPNLRKLYEADIARMNRRWKRIDMIIGLVNDLRTQIQTIHEDQHLPMEITHARITRVFNDIAEPLVT